MDVFKINGIFKFNWIYFLLGLSFQLLSIALQPDDKKTMKTKREGKREKIASSHLVEFFNILIGIDQFSIHNLFSSAYFLLLSVWVCLLWWQMNIFNAEILNMTKMGVFVGVPRGIRSPLNLLESHINRLNGIYFCLDKFNQFILLMKFIYSLSIFNPLRI